MHYPIIKELGVSWTLNWIHSVHLPVVKTNKSWVASYVVRFVANLFFVPKNSEIRIKTE